MKPGSMASAYTGSRPTHEASEAEQPLTLTGRFGVRAEPGNPWAIVSMGVSGSAPSRRIRLVNAESSGAPSAVRICTSKLWNPTVMSSQNTRSAFPRAPWGIGGNGMSTRTRPSGSVLTVGVTELPCACAEEKIEPGAR